MKIDIHNPSPCQFEKLYHNILCLPTQNFVSLPKILINIVLGDFKSQEEKLETMLMQNLGRQTKNIMVFSEVEKSIIIDCHRS